MDLRMAFASRHNRWLYTAAVASSTAGIIHASYMPEHFEMWVGYGIFFLAATVCQVLWALIVLADHPLHRAVLWAGIIGNAAIIAMWIVARTVGNPLGPMAGEIEEIGMLDSLSKIAELTVIVCSAALLREKDGSTYKSAIA